MKKALLIIVSIIILCSCSLTANAYISPTVPNSDTDVVSSKQEFSPKTGVSYNYPIVLAGLAGVFGLTAINSKKKADSE